MCENNMCRYVPGAYRPFSYAVRPKAVQGSGTDVVFGIGNQKLSGVWVDGDSIRCLDTLFGTVFDKVARNDLPCARVYDGIGYRPIVCQITPFGTVKEQRIPTQGHVRVGQVLELVCDLVSRSVDYECFRRYFIIVSAGRNIQVAVIVRLYPVKVDSDIYFFSSVKVFKSITDTVRS